MRLSDLFSGKKDLVVEFENGNVELTYNNAYFTKENSLLAVSKDTLFIDYVIDSFCNGLLISWNVQDEKGKPIKIAKKQLEQVPMELLLQLFQAIQEDAIKLKNA